MEDCNPNITPTTLERLGPDVDRKKMNESWDYASIIGMLMYLANNTRPGSCGKLVIFPHLVGFHSSRQNIH